MTATRLPTAFVIGVALCLATIPLAGQATLSSTQFVILDSANSFTDTIEAGATISQRVGPTLGAGPVSGSGLLFACGTPDVADFSQVISQFGGTGGGPLGTCATRPREIISGDVQFTARVTLSGNKYGVDFLSWALTLTSCVDADGGLSCAAAGGRTSYNRVQADSTPPTTTVALAPPTPNGQNGWYVSEVTVTVSATDNDIGSGVAETRCILDPVSAPATFDDVPVGCAYMGAGAGVTPDGVHQVYAASVDNAGNEETPVNTSFMIDQTHPTVTCDVGSPGPIFLLGGIGGNVTATVNDPTPGSGPVAASLSGAANVSSVGNKTISLTGEDVAGNATTVDCPYRVEYDFLGFFQPVDKLPTLNPVKAGAAVPVKFGLDGFQGLDIFVSGYPASVRIDCDSTAEVDGIEDTETAGSSSLSYASALDQYSYVWKTNKAWANTCRQLVVNLTDGTFHRADFQFK